MIRIAHNVPGAGKLRRSPAEVLQTTGGASPRGSSYWKQLRRCPREHALATVVKLRPERSQEALTVGLLFHNALEAYYRTVQQHQARLTKRDDEFFFGAMDAAEAAALQTLEPFLDEDGYEETVPEVERLVSAYLEHYRGQDRWRVLAVEETLAYEEPSGFAYTARVDLVVEDEADQRTKVVEHKTARYITEDLLSNYQMDIQILGQKFLWERCVDDSAFYPFGGILVNIVSKKKRPGPELLRVPVMPSPKHVQAFYDSQRAWDSLAPAFSDLGYPKALGNCVGAPRYFKTCPYYALCHGHPEYTVEDWQREIAHAGPPVGYKIADDHDEDEER